MNSPDDSAGSKASRAISKSVPGPDFLRYYPAHRAEVEPITIDALADVEVVTPMCAQIKVALSQLG